nr:hypothetical protein [Planctomicrobium piriforme]
MLEREATVDSFDALHAYVHDVLCESENLLKDQFRTTRRALLSKGELCGIEFSLQGLRAVRLGAIWAADQNVILFYNARGERALKVKLTRRIPVETQAAG